MNSYPLWKPVVVLLVLAACALFLYPPERKLKPGLDLAGGTTLVYDVRIPDDEQVNAGRMIDDIIAILKDRVDPTGTRNLVWRRQAGNRIEIQMALATAQTGERRQAYDRALEELFKANIAEADLDAALKLPDEDRAERLAELAAGNAQRLGLLQELAGAYDALVAIEQPYNEIQQDYRAAKKQLEELEASESATQDKLAETRQNVAELEERLAQLAVDVADAREQYDELREKVEEPYNEVQQDYRAAKKQLELEASESTTQDLADMRPTSPSSKSVSPSSLDVADAREPTSSARKCWRRTSSRSKSRRSRSALEGETR